MPKWERWVGLALINAVLYLSLTEAKVSGEWAGLPAILSAGAGVLLTALMEMLPVRPLHLVTVLVCQASLTVLVAVPIVASSLVMRALVADPLPGLPGMVAAAFWVALAPGCLAALWLSTCRRLQRPAEPELARAAGQWEGPVSAVLTRTHLHTDNLLVLTAPDGRPVAVRLLHGPAKPRPAGRKPHRSGTVVDLSNHMPHHFRFSTEGLFEVILFGLSPRTSRMAGWFRGAVSRLAYDCLSLQLGMTL